MNRMEEVIFVPIIKLEDLQGSATIYFFFFSINHVEYVIYTLRSRKLTTIVRVKKGVIDLCKEISKRDISIRLIMENEKWVKMKFVVGWNGEGVGFCLEETFLHLLRCNVFTKNSRGIHRFRGRLCGSPRELSRTCITC